MGHSIHAHGIWNGNSCLLYRKETIYLNSVFVLVYSVGSRFIFGTQEKDITEREREREGKEKKKTTHTQIALNTKEIQGEQIISWVKC